MTYTCYPFDNQDTTESQYSALFRELQDSGVVDSYGGTSLAVAANASAMSVTLAVGNAIVRGFFFNNDAVATLPISAASGSVRYDAVVLQLDPATNTITPVVKANAGATPALTQTDTGIFEILLAVVTVNAGAVTIAAGDVADRRAFVSSRVGAWSDATRPANPRKYSVGFNNTSGLWEYHSGAAWTRLAPVSRGSGTAFPTVNLVVGDTFTRTDLGNSLWKYDGTGWYPLTPVFGKVWGQPGFQGVGGAGSTGATTFNGLTTSGGFTLNSSNYQLVVPLDGLYQVEHRAYLSGGTITGSATMSVVRTRTGVSNTAGALAAPLDKNATVDKVEQVGDIFPLKAGDGLWQFFQTGGGGGVSLYKGGEWSGCMVAATYLGPLNGATPL